MRGGQFILGHEVRAFEEDFSNYLGVEETVAVGTGTDAIELMLRALDLGQGDAVVIPTFAPSAVAAGVERAGCTVVLADVEPESLTLCPDALDEILSSDRGRQVRAALAVHLFGHPADWERLSAVAQKHGIELLEDAAQSHGTRWRNRLTGSLGRMAAFSFYPTKNLGALGDAGAVTTSDPDLAERLRELRQYGWRRRYISDQRGGINSRMDELQAAILRAKLPLLAEAPKLIADPQVRNRGTIGGDIAHGDPANDHPALSIAIDATFVLQGPKGTRQVKAEDFYASWRIPSEENPGGFNCTRVNDPEIDEWLKTAGSTTDVAVRQEAYCNIADKLYNDIVNEIVVGMGVQFSASSSRLQGWEMNEAFVPFAIFGWDAENWYVTE